FLDCARNDKTKNRAGAARHPNEAPGRAQRFRTAGWKPALPSVEAAHWETSDTGLLIPSAPKFRDTTARVPPEKSYFGERESACVFTLRRCLSTTRRNSRSIILNASCIAFAKGSCVPLSICFSSATNSWPGGTVTSIRTRNWFPFL